MTYTTDEVRTQIDGMVDNLQNEVDEYTKVHFAKLTSPVIVATRGRKYTKIIRRDRHTDADGNQTVGGGSVHMFIVNATGDVLKAASWNAPAKHVRGNIFNKKYDFDSSYGVYGAAYLRR